MKKLSLLIPLLVLLFWGSSVNANSPKASDAELPIHPCIFEKMRYEGHLADKSSAWASYLGLVAAFNYCILSPSPCPPIFLSTIINDLVGAQAHYNELNAQTPMRQDELNTACYDYATPGNLDKVYYYNGTFTKSGNNWTEVTLGGNTLSFEQTHTDNTSVYLKATDRNDVYIQLDLDRRIILYKGPSYTHYVYLYPIDRVSSTLDLD